MVFSFFINSVDLTEFICFIERTLFRDKTEPKIIIFAKKEIIPIDKLGVYNIDSFFSIHNPKDEPLIVNSRYVKIPTKIFFGEPYEPSKPMVRPVEPGDEISKPFMIEVKPKDTETIKVSFSINVSKEGLYPVSYCIMSLGKEICSEETYTQIEVKFEDDEE